MATYIQGITDYIPQFQPFQPDYNFLGNVLQTAQSKYDSNYDAISKTYGTLLNSPMMREDNIKQREEYFKMIDQDIKKMSGLDLSLQQNVDAADKVFQSFYKNKGMVHDMVYTKEYQNQLQRADNFKNCIDQEKCGGKFWETGVLDLNYKADEFKKASKDQALMMNPGEYTPYIDLQEKATKYAKELLGTSGAFGVQTVTKSADGRYLVTLKNGQNLALPLNNLLQNQYGNDPAIQKMFKAQSYVNRKSFIQQNAEKYGSEDAAEDEYFRQVDQKAYVSSLDKKELEAYNKSATARQAVLEQQVKTQGVPVGDPNGSLLANALGAAMINKAAISKNLEIYDETGKIAKSMYEAGDDRVMKRQRADAFAARYDMTRDIGDTASIIASMTGQETIEEDPYAKSYYDFSLAMAKQADAYDRQDINAKRKAEYDLKKSIYLAQFKKQGSAVGTSNKGFIIHDVNGASSGPDKTNEVVDMSKAISESAQSVIDDTHKFVRGYGGNLMDIINGENYTPESKLLAKETMANIFGKANIVNGKVVSQGFDADRGVFIDMEGNVITDPEAMIKVLGNKGLYNKAITTKDELYKRALVEKDLNKAISDQAVYLDNKGAEHIAAFEADKKMLTLQTDVWRSNNRVVKSLGQFSDTMDKVAWDNMFTSDNNLKSKAKFIEDYSNEYRRLHAGQEPSLSEVSDKYHEMDVKYNQVYNSGAKGIQALNVNYDLGMEGGGKAAGNAIGVSYDGRNPGSYGTMGLLSFIEDAKSNGGMYTAGWPANPEAAMAGSASSGNIKIAIQTLSDKIRSGSVSDKDASTFGQLAYADMAVSDPTKAGLFVKFSPDFLKKYKGTAKAPTWADDPALLKGVSIIIDKNKATNSFTESVKAKYYDTYINHKPVTLIDDDAGKIVINKRNPDGTITVTGNVHGLKPDPNNPGALIKSDISINYTYENSPGGQNVKDNYDVYLAEIAKANKAYKLNILPTVKDYMKLPEIKNLLNRIADQDNSQQGADAFLQTIQF